MICTVIFFPHLPSFIPDSPPPPTNTSNSTFVLNNSNGTIIKWNGSHSLCIYFVLTTVPFCLWMISGRQPPRSFFFPFVAGGTMWGWQANKSGELWNKPIAPSSPWHSDAGNTFFLGLLSIHICRGRKWGSVLVEGLWRRGTLMGFSPPWHCCVQCLRQWSQLNMLNYIM